MKYFSLILLQPVNPCNSIISTVTHRAERDRRKKMKNTKKTAMYQVREFIGNDYSKPLGLKLRTKSSAMKISKRLKKRGMVVFLSKIMISI